MVLEEPYQSPAIVVGDLDGDGAPEVAAVYRWQKKCYAIVLKEYYNFWYIAANIEGEGYDINYFLVKSAILLTNTGIFGEVLISNQALGEILRGLTL